jgi:hypothetical protein
MTPPSNANKIHATGTITTKSGKSARGPHSTNASVFA